MYNIVRVYNNFYKKGGDIMNNIVNKKSVLVWMKPEDHKLLKRLSDNSGISMTCAMIHGAKLFYQGQEELYKNLKQHVEE